MQFQNRKFENIIKKKQEQHKPTDTIKIVRIQDEQTVLLFQDMFPATADYITEPYIRGGQAFCIADPKIVSALEKTAQKVIKLLHRGIKFTPTQPDVNRIERLMVDEIQANKTEVLSDKPVSMKERMVAARVEAERHNARLTPSLDGTRKRDIDLDH